MAPAVPCFRRNGADRCAFEANAITSKIERPVTVIARDLAVARFASRFRQAYR
jgi:hypothetical protein